MNKYNVHILHEKLMKLIIILFLINKIYKKGKYMNKILKRVAYM